MRIDAYMQVSQIYQANKTKNAPKTGKAGSRDSLEISSYPQMPEMLLPLRSDLPPQVS